MIERAALLGSSGQLPAMDYRSRLIQHVLYVSQLGLPPEPDPEATGAPFGEALLVFELRQWSLEGRGLDAVDKKVEQAGGFLS